MKVALNTITSNSHLRQKGDLLIHFLLDCIYLKSLCYTSSPASLSSFLSDLLCDFCGSAVLQNSRKVKLKSQKGIKIFKTIDQVEYLRSLSSDNKLNLTRFMDFEFLYYNNLKSYDNMLNLTGWVSGPYNTSRVKVS